MSTRVNEHNHYKKRVGRAFFFVFFSPPSAFARHKTKQKLRRQTTTTPRRPPRATTQRPAACGGDPKCDEKRGDFRRTNEKKIQGKKPKPKRHTNLNPKRENPKHKDFFFLLLLWGKRRDFDLFLRLHTSRAFGAAPSSIDTCPRRRRRLRLRRTTIASRRRSVFFSPKKPPPPPPPPPLRYHR